MSLTKLFRFSESGKTMLPAAVVTLKEDFKGENADARPDEDMRRTDYMLRTEKAKARSAKEPRDVELKLQLAESYAILDPDCKEALSACQECLEKGVKSLELQRQGDFWYLYGRSLFLADRPDEALLAFLDAKRIYATKGNKAVRKLTNCGLLRVYAALGKSKLAAERLEVALTMCDDLDSTCLLYMHAKHALEQTGNERDAEVLDDIWYVELDTNRELRNKFEQYEGMCKGVLKQSTGTGSDDDDKPLTWDDAKKNLRRALVESYRDPVMRGLVFAMFGLLVVAVMMLGFLKANR
jgi:hypothetical protein